MAHPKGRDKEHEKKWKETKEKLLEYITKNVGYHSIREINRKTKINRSIIKKHVEELEKDGLIECRVKRFVKKINGKVVEKEKCMGVMSTEWTEINTQIMKFPYDSPDYHFKKDLVKSLQENKKSYKSYNYDGEGIFYGLLPDEQFISSVDREIMKNLCEILLKGLKEYPTIKKKKLAFVFLVDVKKLKKLAKKELSSSL